MTTEQYDIEITKLLGSLGRVEALKRLQGVAGVEQPLVSPTRSEEEHGAAEQRSVESRAISPGKADEAALNFIMDHCERAAEDAYEAPKLWDQSRQSPFGYIKMGEQCAYERIAYLASLLLRKPDSDADHQGRADE